MAQSKDQIYRRIIRQAVEQISSTVDPGRCYLGDQVEIESSFDSPAGSLVLLIMWWVNPHGPTEVNISLEKDLKYDQWLLLQSQLHPFAPNAKVLGLIPSTELNRPQFLFGLFSELLRPGFLEGSAPDYLVPCWPDQFDLKLEDLRDLFHRLLPARDFAEAAAIQKKSSLQRFREEVDAIRRAVAGTDLITDATERTRIQLKALANGSQEDAVSDVDEEVAFSVWWKNATDPMLKDYFTAQMQEAWNTSLLLVKGPKSGG